MPSLGAIVVGVLFGVFITATTAIVSPYNPNSQYYSTWPKPVEGLAREECYASCPNGTVNLYHCCPNTCDKCGACNGEWTHDLECCWSTIQSNAYLYPDTMICGPGASPPCVVNATRYDCDPKITGEFVVPEWAKWEEWPRSVLYGVLVVLAMVAIFILYSCFCFGHRKPPAPYTALKGYTFKRD